QLPGIPILETQRADPRLALRPKLPGHTALHISLIGRCLCAPRNRRADISPPVAGWLDSLSSYGPQLDLFPPLEGTWVAVSRLVSSEAISKTSLLPALGTLMSEKRTEGAPPPGQFGFVLLPLPRLVVPAWHTTVGMR